jgi:hypothetical protein
VDAEEAEGVVVSQLLEEIRELTLQVEDMSRMLLVEYDKFCETVRTNGLQRIHHKNWQTTFEIPRNTWGLEWHPDSTDTTDITMADGDSVYFMPKAYLEDPEAWLQSALAAHGQSVADNAASSARKRAERKAELRAELERLEAQE